MEGRVVAALRAPHISAVLRRGERVTPLELFFDLVFVLAITQCTALMAREPTWLGLAKGLLVLGVQWCVSAPTPHAAAGYWAGDVGRERRRHPQHL